MSSINPNNDHDHCEELNEPLLLPLATSKREEDESAPRGRCRLHRELSFLEFATLSPGPDDIHLSGMRTYRYWLGVFCVSASMCLFFFVAMIGLIDRVVKGANWITLGFLLIPAFFLGVPSFLMWYYRRYGPVQYCLLSKRIASLICGKYSIGTAQSLYKLGQYYETQKEMTKALSCYQEIAAFPICNHDPAGAPFHGKVGKTLYAMGRYPEALEAFETALSLRNKLEKSSFVLRLQADLHCIGQTHEKMGNFQQALQLYREALTAMLERGHKQSVETARSYVLIGSVYGSMNKLDDALENLNEALKLHLINVGEFPRSKVIAELYVKIGNMQAKKGHGSLAAENFQLAVDVYRRGGKSDEDRAIQSLLRRIADESANV